MAEVPWIGAICEDYPGSLLDLRHRIPHDLPESERGLSLASAAGFPADEQGARLAVRGPLPDVTGRVGTEPYVHPGAAVPARRPTAGHQAIVAALLPVVIEWLSPGRWMKRPSPALWQVVRQLTSEGSCPSVSWPRFWAERMSCCAEYRPSPSSRGCRHARGFAVRACSVRSARGPLRSVPRVVLGDQEAPCRDTRMRTCTISGHPCLTSITPGEVVAP